MKEIISKELLSEVLCDNKIICCAFTSELGFDAVEYVWVGCRAIDDCEEFVEHINIYELAHKCKEWAKENGYDILSYKSITQEEWFAEIPPIGWKTWNFSTINAFWTSTEPEAIFKACQWILDNKEQK